MLENRRLWEAWLKGYENDVRVFIHSKFEFDGLDFPHKIIETVPTEWGGYGLVEATLRLYEAAATTAMTEGINISHCILLSNSCIPVKRFQYVKAAIKEGISFIHESPRIEIFRRYTPLFRLYKVEDVAKHSQWIILCKEHYMKVLREEEDIKRIFENITIPDECWALTYLCNERAHIDTTTYTTFVDWSEDQKPNKKRYTGPGTYTEPPDEELMKKLFLGPHLFARKFICDMSFLSTVLC